MHASSFLPIKMIKLKKKKVYCLFEENIHVLSFHLLLLHLKYEPRFYTNNL